MWGHINLYFLAFFLITWSCYSFSLNKFNPGQYFTKDNNLQPLNRIMKRTNQICTSLPSSSDASINDSTVPKTLRTASSNKKKGGAHNKRLEVLIYFALWYFLSIFYNIYNKRALELLKLPWLVATVQMGMGLPLFIPLWAFRIRDFPADNFRDFRETLSTLNSVAIYQTLTHISGVIALGAGSVSFIQVIKASEPAFTAFISAVFENEYFTIPVYLTLIPVIAGVAMASATELSFSWYCLFAGVMANVFAAARGVFGKKQMCGDTKCIENISPENYYAILTLMSFMFLLPLTMLFEGSKITQLIFSETTSSGVKYALASGLFFYLYNEVSFKALNNVHPVTHALANTIKRIVIILTSLLVFRNPIKPLGVIGSVLAISGVLAYSLAQHYSKKKTE